MTNVADVCRFMDEFSPTAIAEAWDNVGLLVGDDDRPIQKIMTCLTVTPESLEEAIQESADLIVTHHPMPFQPLKKITCDNTVGWILHRLIENSIAVYSPHTGFDSAEKGINQLIAESLKLQHVRPICPFDEGEPGGPGSGRMGRSEQPVGLLDFAKSLKSQFQLSGVHYVGDTNAPVNVVGVACGSGSSFLSAAIEAGCDTMITGESNFHTCLEARAHSVSLILLGHFGSERFALEILADQLKGAFPDIHCWACVRESDPVNWI